MRLHKNITRTLFLAFFVCFSLNSFGDKNKKGENNKKADIKKVSRGEHNVVLKWDALHRDTQKRKKSIKKKFR